MYVRARAHIINQPPQAIEKSVSVGRSSQKEVKVFRDLGGEGGEKERKDSLGYCGPLKIN
jgi:hypothetical protein